MTEVNVNFYLKRNEEKADGTVPILGRIRVGKSMVQFSAKVSVPVSLWDTKPGRATGKSKTVVSVNASLNKICVAAHSAYKDLSAKQENVSATEVKNAFQGIASQQDTLVKYYEAHKDNFLKNVGVNRTMKTYKRYGISLEHLKRFMRKKYNVSDMPFQALIPSFVADYDYYLRGKGFQDRYIPLKPADIPRWTDKKTGLIEIIYSLEALRSLDGGEIALRKIQSHFEVCFGVNLGNISRALAEMRIRNNPTMFLDSMKQALLDRMNEHETTNLQRN